MSDERLGSSAKQWEVRARVDYPLHYFIWLHEHESLEEKLNTINSNKDTASQVNFINKNKRQIVL